ncbi:hypothetical protein OB920_17660 [Halobacteria archaeon HArc-gm2]|nr:hypothetical protein [Halobacteria archaeon HArc-gm2]
MSVIQTVKSAVGLESDQSNYECVECGTTFEKGMDPDSYWFKCPECETREPLGGDHE